MPELKEKVFKDIPLSFTAHPVTGNIKPVVNRDAVKQSVKSLVLTNFYERPYNPTLGGDIRSQLFENMDTLTEFNISKNIRQVIDNFEPRALLDDIKVQATPDSNALNVTIIFRVQNSSEPIIINILLERIR